MRGEPDAIEGQAGRVKVKQERPEPPGWRSRDEIMDAVWQNNRYTPAGLFMLWYGCVLLSNQVRRLIWIAAWELRRKRLQRSPASPARALPRTAARGLQRRGWPERNSR